MYSMLRLKQETQTMNQKVKQAQLLPHSQPIGMVVFFGYSDIKL